MLAELVAYGFVLVLLPAIWIGASVRAWWYEPVRAFHRSLWLTEHHLNLPRGSVAVQGDVETQPAAEALPEGSPAAGIYIRAVPLAAPEAARTEPATGSSLGAPGRGPKTAADVVSPEPTSAASPTPRNGEVVSLVGGDPAGAVVGIAPAGRSAA